jgi:hypothetical protein
VEESARRVLEAKARLGLQRTRTVNLDAVPLTVGGRKHDAVARISERSIPADQDARKHRSARRAQDRERVVSLVLDYPSGWRIAAQPRGHPALKARWPKTESSGDFRIARRRPSSISSAPWPTTTM